MRSITIFHNFTIRIVVMFIILSTFSIRSLSAITFTNSGQSLGYQPVNLEIDIGDVDNDGDYDLLLASQGSSGAVEIYINNGSGIFTKLQQQFPQAQSSSGGTFEDTTFGVSVSDVNNDGWLDVITADAWDGVNVYVNDKTGHFLISQLGIGTATVGAGTGGIEVKGVALGDIDNDGDLDMVFGGHQYDTDNEVWINDGQGLFSDTGQRHYSEAVWHMAFGDLDNDNDLDYVFTSRYREQYTTTEVYFNDGEGTFIHSNQDFLPNGSSFGLLLRDVDNDGDLDFIEPNDAGSDPSAAPRLRVFLNDGSGIFSDSGQSLGGSGVKDADLGDIDNDGDYDLVIANWLMENSLLINDGAGRFSKVGQDVLFSGGSHACKVGDLDKDGDIDLVIGNLLVTSYEVHFSNQALITPNTPPSPPTSLWGEYSNGQVILMWGNGDDLETQRNTLTYNLRVGTNNNPHSVFSGAVSCGPGNMGHSFIKTLNNLPDGIYAWSVQTVDSSYTRSNWATSRYFRISEEGFRPIRPKPWTWLLLLGD